MQWMVGIFENCELTEFDPQDVELVMGEGGCFGVSWCLIDLPVNGKYAVSRVIDLFRFCVEAARGPARDGRSRVLRFMWSVRGSQFLLPFRLKGCV